MSALDWAQGFLQLAANPGFWAVCLLVETEPGLHPCKVTPALCKNKLAETEKLSEGRGAAGGRGRRELPRK